MPFCPTFEFLKKNHHISMDLEEIWTFGRKLERKMYSYIKEIHKFKAKIVSLKVSMCVILLNVYWTLMNMYSCCLILSEMSVNSFISFHGLHL